MSTADGAAPRPGFFTRVWNFALELWGVLVRPSSVFGLGVLVMAGFVAGGMDFALTIIPGALILGPMDHLFHVILGATFLVVGWFERAAAMPATR